MERCVVPDLALSTTAGIARTSRYSIPLNYDQISDMESFTSQPTLQYS